MGAVSMTTVLSFESVGAILVVAFLIVPGATAYLITHKLKNYLYGFKREEFSFKKLRRNLILLDLVCFLSNLF